MDTTTDSPFEKWVRGLDQNIVALNDEVYSGSYKKPSPTCKICESKSIKCGIQIAFTCLSNVTGYKYNISKKKLTLFSAIETRISVKNIQVMRSEDLKILSQCIGVERWSEYQMHYLKISTRCWPNDEVPLAGDDDYNERPGLIELGVSILYSRTGLQNLYADDAASQKERDLRIIEMGLGSEDADSEESES